MLLAGRPLWINRLMSNYEIGVLTKEFVSEYSKLIDSFDDETNFEYYNKQSVINVINSTIEADNAVRFHLLKDNIPIGLIAGLILPHINDTSEIVLMELAWFIRKEDRGSIWSIKLFKKFEEAGKKAGATSIMMILRQNLEDHNVDNFYRKMGYTLSEKSFIKRF